MDRRMITLLPNHTPAQNYTSKNFQKELNTKNPPSRRGPALHFHVTDEEWNVVRFPRVAGILLGFVFLCLFWVFFQLRARRGLSSFVYLVASTLRILTFYSVTVYARSDIWHKTVSHNALFHRPPSQPKICVGYTLDLITCNRKNHSGDSPWATSCSLNSHLVHKKLNNSAVPINVIFYSRALLYSTRGILYTSKIYYCQNLRLVS
ncbi:LAMI_0H07316g1_1 [Lachancea mirantina]|uniref:LAMI_0H07316g1_1 n=1 Tax=Lachancea mirantina TaxID=1230905 RepID=A0A1G4KG04_9SACH|nr:LAMI_0H07316g1_1 [Lachancea mirantina]